MFFKLLRREEGQEALEFAIILPVLLFIVVLMLTFGKVVYARMAAELAAREAARTYAVLSNQELAPSAVAAMAREAAASNISGILPVEKEYFDAESDVSLQDVSLASGAAVPDPSGEYCQAEVKVRVPIEAPWFRRLLGKSYKEGAEGWEEPFGKPKEGEYVVEVKGDAVFKKEPKIEASGEPGS